MARLDPVVASLVDPAWAERVVSPAHDALSPAERRAHLARHPHSYLGVTRSVDDLDPAGRRAGVDVLARCQRALDRLRSAGAFGPPAGPRLWVYRLDVDGHHQTGVVGGLPVADIEAGDVLAHERVDEARAVDLADHVLRLRVQSSPIVVACRPRPDLAPLLAELAGRTEPEIDLMAADGLRQRVWSLDRPVDRDRVASLVAGRPYYLIDGHHRARAAVRVRRAHPSPAAASVLTAVFPSDELTSRAFARCLPSVEPRELLAELGRRFPVRPVADAIDVASRDDAELALRAAGRWYLVALPPDAQPVEPAGNREPAAYRVLDTVRLQRWVLGPILGIDPSRPGDQLAYLPPDAAVTTVDEDGGCGAVWLVRPVPVPDLLAVADAGLTLPPKSTYFEPKVRSGLFLRSVD